MLLRLFKLQFCPPVRSLYEPAGPEAGAETHLEDGEMVGTDSACQPSKNGQLPGEQFGTEASAAIQRMDDH